MQHIVDLEERLNTAVLCIRDEVLHGIVDPAIEKYTMLVLTLHKGVLLESRSYYLQNGKEAQDRYNTDALTLFKKYIDYIDKYKLHQGESNASVHARRLIDMYVSLSNNWSPQEIANNPGVADSNKKYTHRVHILAENYKIESNEAKHMPPAEIEKKYGAKRKQAYYTLTKKGVTYKKPTEKELEKAIELLHDSPIARLAAEKDLSLLKKS